MIRPVGGSRRGRGLAQWFRELPPTTRAYVVCCTAMTLLCGLELVSPYSVVLVRPALTQLQLWRLLTNLLWLGPLNLGTLLHFVLLITYSSKMEVWMASTAPVPDRAASQFPYFMAVSMALLNGAGLLLSQPLMSRAVVPMLLFVYCRTRPREIMNFLFGSLCVFIIFISIGRPPLPDQCAVANHFFTVPFLLSTCRRR
eukprot:RCo039795